MDVLEDELKETKRFSEIDFTKVIENAEPVISRSDHYCNKSLLKLKGEKDDHVRVKVDLPKDIDAWGGEKDLRKLLKVDQKTRQAMISTREDVINYHEACNRSKVNSTLKSVQEKFKESPEQEAAREKINQATLKEISIRVEKRKYNKLTENVPGF